jgi:hypothetical protein
VRKGAGYKNSGGATLHYPLFEGERSETVQNPLRYPDHRRKSKTDFMAIPICDIFKARNEAFVMFHERIQQIIADRSACRDLNEK